MHVIQITLCLDFSLKNEHNCRVTVVFKKADKLSVLLNYMSLVLGTKASSVGFLQLKQSTT